MAKQIINIGRTANDRSGDPLRTAFNKVNENFTELYSAIGADVQIPVQTDNGGKFLTTNGTTLSWSSISQEVGTANTGFVDNRIYNLNGPTLSNDDLVHGATARLSIPEYGDTVNPISLYNNYGNFAILLGPSGTITSTWTFDASGSVTFPSNGTINNTTANTGPTGTIYTFTNDGSATPGIDNTNVVYLDNTVDAQAVQAGWIITFANSTQKTVTLSDIGLPPNAGKRMLEFTGNITLIGSDVWPLTVQSADYSAGSSTNSLEITPDGTTAWTFNNNSDLILPVGGDIKDSTGITKFKTNLSQYNNDLEIDANTLTGTTLAENVTGSSLTSVGILGGLTSSGIVHITNTQDSTNADTGALQVDGGAHITKNLIAEGTIYAGVDAYSEALTNPLMVASSPSGVAGGYSQVAILNNTAEASGDFQVMVDGYDVNVSDTGWADLGMAGSNFSDARYTITEPGDGYVFVSGKEGSTNKGSLVLATDSSGQTNDIVFATGGFTTADEKMRLKNSDGSLNIVSGVITSDNAIQLTSNGNTFQVGAGGAVDIPGAVTWTNTSDPWQAVMNWNDIDKFFIVSSPSDFKIVTNDGQVSYQTWTFGTNGVITLPAGGDIKDSSGNSVFSSTYTLPTASDTVLGGVKVDGTTVVIVDGVISATGAGGGGYSLPTASTSTLGGVKVDGSTININGSGVISAVIPTNVSTFTNDAGYLTSVTTITGNAGTATKLETARNINGVAFDGSGNITVTAAAGTLTGNTLNAGITQSSLTSVGTLTNLTVTNPISGSVTGSAGEVSGANITGTTLASGVVSSSLTSVGTLANLTVTNPIVGTVQNGVVTTGTYADPSWITSLAYSKLTGTPTLFSGAYADLTGKPTGLVTTADTGTVTNTMLANSSMTLNGTLVNLGDNVTLDAAANLLMGSTLASNVTASSLTSVGTLTGLTVSGTLTRSGNISATQWGLNGIGLKLPAATYTDTSSTTTLTNNYVHTIGVPTLAFSSPTTVSQSATLYIAGDPVAGANATLSSGTNTSLWVAGKSYFQGSVRMNGTILSGGGASMLSFTNSTANILAPTASTSTTTGGLVVAGGVGIAGNVNTGGYVTQAALPAFRVYGSGSTTITVNTILTSSHFTLDYQQGGTNLAVATGIFSAPIAGLYQVNLSGRAYSNAGVASQLAVVKNHVATPSNAVVMIEWAANTTVNHLGASTVVKLAVGDTLVAKVLLGSAQFDQNDSWSVAFLG